MTLKDLLIAVKDHTLSKEQVEGYRDNLLELCAEMLLEVAELEKAEAIFMVDNKENSDIATKRNWQVTKSGQRLIELKRYILATNKLTDSLKSRIYAKL